MQQLIDAIKAKRAELADVKAALEDLENELIDSMEAEIDAALRAKDDPFGTVNAGGIKFVIPKNVSWDQSILSSLYEDIKSSGQDASEYIKVKYDVSETSFKSWPTPIKDEFMKARTVKPGKIKIELGEE